MKNAPLIIVATFLVLWNRSILAKSPEGDSNENDNLEKLFTAHRNGNDNYLQGSNDQIQDEVINIQGDSISANFPSSRNEPDPPLRFGILYSGSNDYSLVKLPTGDAEHFQGKGKTKNPYTHMDRNSFFKMFGRQNDQDFIRTSGNVPSPNEGSDLISTIDQKSEVSNDKYLNKFGIYKDEMRKAETNNEFVFRSGAHSESLRVAPNRYNYQSVASNPYQSTAFGVGVDDNMNGENSRLRSSALQTE